MNTAEEPQQVNEEATARVEGPRPRKRGRPQLMTPEEKAQKIREAAVLRPGLFRKHKELHAAEIKRIRADYDAQIAALRAELADTMTSLARVSTLLSKHWKGDPTEPFQVPELWDVNDFINGPCRSKS